MEQEQKTTEKQAVQAGGAQSPDERWESRRRAQQEIGQFAALFPGVGPEQVPEEVWQEVRRGQSLAMAYALCRIRTLEDALARKERNAKLSAGSAGSAGSAVPGGTVASFWDAYEM